jgi:hypothetical protein
VLRRIYPYGDMGLALWQMALEICRRVLGEQDPDTLIAMNRRAVWLFGMGEHPDEALDMQKKVLELSRSIRGEEHVDTLIAMNNLWVTLGELKYRFKSLNPKECWDKQEELSKQQNQLAGRVTGSQTLLSNPV